MSRIDQKEVAHWAEVLSGEMGKGPDNPFKKVKTREKNATTKRCSVLLADCHHPDVDWPTWYIAMCAIRDLDPTDVYIMGDFLELESMSRYPPVDTDAPDLLADYRSGRHALEQIEMAFDAADKKYRKGKKKKRNRVFLEGNHEWRFNRKMASDICTSVRRLVPPPAKGLALDRFGWDWVDRHRQPIKVGSLYLHHGQWYNKHHAMKHLEMLTVDMVYGHTHRPQLVSKTVWDHSSEHPSQRQITVSGLPCMRRIQKDWEHMKNICEWVNGFGVIEWTGDKPHLYPIIVNGGEAAYAQHRWEVPTE